MIMTEKRQRAPLCCFVSGTLFLLAQFQLCAAESLRSSWKLILRGSSSTRSWLAFTLVSTSSVNSCHSDLTVI